MLVNLQLKMTFWLRARIFFVNSTATPQTHFLPLEVILGTKTKKKDKERLLQRQQLPRLYKKRKITENKA